MATIGFIVIVLLALFFLAQAIFVIVGTAYLGGKLPAYVLFPIVMAALLFHYAYNNVPFTVTFS